MQSFKTLALRYSCIQILKFNVQHGLPSLNSTTADHFGPDCQTGIEKVGYQNFLNIFLPSFFFLMTIVLVHPHLITS